MKKSLLVFFLQLSLVAVNAQGWLPDKETGSVYEPDEYGVVEDYDGNVYRTARFGDTWWMLENLRCKHYNDGTAVTSCEEVEAKRPAKTGYYLWFGNVATWAYPDADSTKMEKYGLLYTWNAGADAIENGLNKKPLYTFNCHGGLLPEGWKIADTTAWFNLANRMMSEDEIIGSWVTRNTPSGGIERVFEITSVKDMGLYIKSPVGEGWKESEVLNVVNPEMWNKSELGLVASGSMGGDINSDGEIPVMGIDEYGWYWTDQFVHEDSSGNGKRYIYLVFDTNNLVTRNNATANHGSVGGIKRVEREQV